MLPVRFVWLYLALICFVSCSLDKSKDAPTIWKLVYTPTHATGFCIYANADSTNLRIVLTSPESDTIKDFIIASNKQYRSVCLSTTHLPMFQTIDALDQVVGVGFASLIKNAAVKESITQGTIRDISHGDGVSEEILVQLKPDFFLVYSYGDKDYSIYQKRNIEVIPIAEYLEKTPLGRSEWVVLVGALTGKLDQAKASFQALEQRYFQSQQQVQMLAKPTVFTGYYNSGNWYAPPGNSFVARFLKDAGAQYLFADTLANENLIIPFEKMFVAMHQCQYWGKLAFTPDNPTLENFAADAPQLSQLPSYQAKHLFYCNTQTTDYFGDAVMQPDIILKDLIHIFHPELDTAYQPVYFFAL